MAETRAIGRIEVRDSITGIRRVAWAKGDDPRLLWARIVGRVEISRTTGVTHGIELELDGGERVAVYWEREKNAFVLIDVPE